MQQESATALSTLQDSYGEGTEMIHCTVVKCHCEFGQSGHLSAADDCSQQVLK